MRVLVYETSEDRAKLIRDLLGTYRYKIFHKNGDSTSLTPLQEIKPSLIIMNANCREHVELFEKIKQNSRYSKIPIILISKMDSIEIFKKYNFTFGVYKIGKGKVRIQLNGKWQLDMWMNLVGFSNQKHLNKLKNF